MVSATYLRLSRAKTSSNCATQLSISLKVKTPSKSTIVSVTLRDKKLESVENASIE